MTDGQAGARRELDAGSSAPFTEKGPGGEVREIIIHDSRRLPGPSLLWDRPGAIAEVTIPGDPTRFLILWQEEARRLLDAVGWETEECASRRFPGGASLALSAPIDGLLTATEINEWAIDAAAARLSGAPVPAVRDAAAQLRPRIAAEQNPAVLAMHRAAAERGVICLIDPDELSIGSGTGSMTWPTSAVPDPGSLDWSRIHEVPTIIVTGSNGKTTTVRLLAAVAAAAGRVPGLCCTDGVTVGGAQIEAGDWAGPGGARRVLRNTRVEVAILEAARGGILRRGLAAARADAAIVTNVAEDHFGEWGIFDLPALAETKLVVAKAIGPSGRVVLNADDPALVAAAAQVKPPISWITLDPDHPLVRAHLAGGGEACFPEHGSLVLAAGRDRTPVVAIADIPLTLGGAAQYNVANALGVLALAAAIRLPLEAIALGLRGFRGGDEENPGRLNLFEFDGLQVVIDFAHNPHGMDALVATANALPAKRRLIILGQAGDRNDRAIRDFARSAWGAHPDRIVLKEMEKYLRGRPFGEASGILEAEFIRLGAPPESIVRAGSEIAAVQEALRWARPGDLLLLPTHAERDEVLALMRRLSRTGWKPGEEVELC